MTMPAKRGLGKGLDALIPETEEESKNKKEVVKEVDTIDINKIEPNSAQPRKFFDEDSIQELAESIKQHGLIEPLIVQKSREDFYMIIAGERRWRAAKIAGLKRIPVIVKDYTSQQIMEIALIENLQREDLNPIEEAEAYNRLIEEYNLKQDDVAEKVSKSRAAVTNSLRLLKLDERVRNMIIEDKIKSGHARALLSISDGDKQYSAAVKIFDEKLSVREAEKLAKQINNTEIKKEKKKDSSMDELIYRQYEENLKNVMGTKVNISRKNGGKGKIEIEYYSSDDFDRLIDLLSGIGKNV